MTKLILATVLITVVYSWEDLKWTLLRSVRKILKQKSQARIENNLDVLVGTALILATFPANLVMLLVAPGSLIAKLAVILTELLFIGLVVQIVEKLLSYAPAHSPQVGIWTALTQIVTRLPGPTLQVAGSIINNKELFGTYLKHLAIPIAFGLGLKIISDKFGLDAVQSHADMLIGIAVGALMISITIKLLEKFFRSNNMKLFSYFRIFLGIVIIAILGNYIL
jgi:undecaprenyl pyrophosphate phosphatase UppP